MNAPPVRPRDAATLIVLRRDTNSPRVLMGRRSSVHTFHPDKVVFPGGRVEAGDQHAPAADELHPVVEAKLRAASPANVASRAFAIAAVRETFEEVGIMIGARGQPGPGASVCRSWSPFSARGLLPALSRLRLVARAITPPTGPRRYDARFLAVFADAIAAEVAVAADEIIAPAWLTFEEARAQPLPYITRTVLDELERRLSRDADLSPDFPAPFYFTRNGERHVKWL
ncbi:NUDIX hydrolase [Pseudochelatococcus sp. B33]